MQDVATCGTHVENGCNCPFETRERLLKVGLVKPGPGVSMMPRLTHIQTLTIYVPSEVPSC